MTDRAVIDQKARELSRILQGCRVHEAIRALSWALACGVVAEINDCKEWSKFSDIKSCLLDQIESDLKEVAARCLKGEKGESP